MWLFGKRTKIGQIAREDPEDDVCREELPSFAPEITTDKILPTVDPVKELEIEEQSENSVVEEIPAQPECEEEEKEDPKELGERLRRLPYSARVYALYRGSILPACPDGSGGLYLFEEFGEYSIVSPGDCEGFVRVSGAEGVFKGEKLESDDLEYFFKERSWPYCVTVKNNEEYRAAQSEGYKAYKRTPNGRGAVMVKPISLYRMKELTLRVEYTKNGLLSQSDTYYLDVTRAVFENVEGEKAFARLAKTAAELLKGQSDPFFSVQVLKVRKNLAVCFPLEGNAFVGDRFGGDRVTATAPADDGTVILQIGSDREVTLPLSEGGAFRGQHRIGIAEE